MTLPLPNTKPLTFTKGSVDDLRRLGRDRSPELTDSIRHAFLWLPANLSLDLLHWSPGVKYIQRSKRVSLEQVRIEQAFNVLSHTQAARHHLRKRFAMYVCALHIHPLGR